MEFLKEKYKVVQDDIYGFDFAVYPPNQDEKHYHSLALVK